MTAKFIIDVVIIIMCYNVTLKILKFALEKAKTRMEQELEMWQEDGSDDYWY